jgi:hypothetical protein
VRPPAPLNAIDRVRRGDFPESGSAVIFAETAGFEEEALTELGCPVIFAEVDEGD